MFNAITGYIFGKTSRQKSSTSLKENKPLKSDISNNNIDSKNTEQKRTIIKGEKNKFDFSEEYDEEEPKSLSTSENSLSNDNKRDNELELNPIQSINDIDYWRMAHCLYVKNSLININTINYVPFIKFKKKQEGILSYIGLGNESLIEIKYLAVFDEHFIYMINLSKEENKDDNDAMKTIGNHYDIAQINNIEIIEDNSKNKILVNILFILDNDVESFNSKIKKFYFEKKNALKFLKIIKKLLNIYKIKITYNDKIFGNINFNEIDEVKEEKINEKQINEETKNENKEDKDEEKNINNEKIEKEEEKDKNKEEEKDKNKEEKNENKEEEKEEIKEGDEIFTTENVVEKHAEKQNKNLIDI